MVSSVIDNHLGSNWSPQSPISASNATDKALISASSSNSEPAGRKLEFDESEQSPKSKPSSDYNRRAYYTERQLKEILLKKLEVIYNQAIAKLVVLGYDEELVLRAMLTHGHAYGGLDALSNIMNNATAYMHSRSTGTEVDWKDNKVLADLKQLRKYALASLVCFLRKFRMGWSKKDALWCLFMSELNISKAISMELDVAPNPNGDGDVDSSNTKKANDDLIGVAPGSCRSHDGSGFGVQEYGANRRKRQAESEPERGSSSLSDGDSSSDFLRILCDLTLEEDLPLIFENQKDGKMYSVARLVKDLEKQVAERKEWAHQKALQAARKLSHDLTELKMLRMERDGNQQINPWKPAADDSTLTKISEIESALMRAGPQAGCAYAALRTLEIENAEIRAELEASKLSASESVTMCLEVAKREKKHLKKLLAWEKQRTKLQEDISTEKQKIIETREEMLQVEAAQKTAKENQMQIRKAKEVALLQFQEERSLKNSFETKTKKNHQCVRSKILLDVQRQKDDLQRLENDLQKLTVNPARTHGQSCPTPIDPLPEIETGPDRTCIFCSEDEVSIVFLPCAHQVLCAGCNNEHVKKSKAKCPICRVPIDQRIPVFGVSS